MLWQNRKRTGRGGWQWQKPGGVGTSRGCSEADCPPVPPCTAAMADPPGLRYSGKAPGPSLYFPKGQTQAKQPVHSGPRPVAGLGTCDRQPWRGYAGVAPRAHGGWGGGVPHSAFRDLFKV